MSVYVELSPKEKEIILTLANEGPKTGYDFHLGGKVRRSLTGDSVRKPNMSSSTWDRIHKRLGPSKLNLIKKYDIKRKKYDNKFSDEKGRRKDIYWLTKKGIKIALLNKANIKSIKDNSKLLYNDKDYEYVVFLCDVYESEKLGPEMLGIITDGSIAIGENLPIRALPTDKEKSIEIFRLYTKHPSLLDTGRNIFNMVKVETEEDFEKTVKNFLDSIFTSK
jgi:hypothetical protein